MKSMFHKLRFFLTGLLLFGIGFGLLSGLGNEVFVIAGKNVPWWGISLFCVIVLLVLWAVELLKFAIKICKWIPGYIKSGFEVK